MHRRHFIGGAATGLAGVALPLALSLALPRSARAQPVEREAPVVGAPKIIEALTAKDIVLDRPGQPARPGARPVREAVIDLQVQFTFDSAQLRPQGKRQLDELAMALNDQALRDAGFLLAGHTDRVGDADYNLRLSHERADAVKDYLAQVHGLAPSRLQTIGYGYSRLRDRARPEAAINRRVEVRRLGRPRVQPGMPGVPGVPDPFFNPPRSAPDAARLVPTPK